MNYKFTPATEEEKKAILVFLTLREVKSLKRNFDIDKDEVDSYLEFKKTISSVTKIEIEFNNKVKTIFNSIYLHIDCDFTIFYCSEFYEIIDGKIFDISNDDFLDFSNKGFHVDGNKFTIEL